MPRRDILGLEGRQILSILAKGTSPVDGKPFTNDTVWKSSKGFAGKRTLELRGRLARPCGPALLRDKVGCVTSR